MWGQNDFRLDYLLISSTTQHGLAPMVLPACWARPLTRSRLTEPFQRQRAGPAAYAIPGSRNHLKNWVRLGGGVFG
ncbi:hypothetical protein LF1_50110 [Rubripirellula obstinata]|uniref:Uncharacterized protein n=1 Tax=Rubripirellula obstinata TaxID=406547 RepID=A0A5B1CMN5_9BACT|nr:hypothetical protein LF1_50110 [Rubripirellula obstinata]